MISLSTPQFGSPSEFGLADGAAAGCVQVVLKILPSSARARKRKEHKKRGNSHAMHPFHPCYLLTY